MQYYLLRRLPGWLLRREARCLPLLGRELLRWWGTSASGLRDTWRWYSEVWLSRRLCEGSTEGRGGWALAECILRRLPRWYLCSARRREKEPGKWASRKASMLMSGRPSGSVGHLETF